MNERNRYAVVVEPMNVVRGTIQRVNDPAEIGTVCRIFLLRCLFANEMKIGVCLRQAIVNGVLRGQVGFGYQIARRLLRGLIDCCMSSSICPPSRAACSQVS